MFGTRFVVAAAIALALTLVVFAVVAARNQPALDADAQLISMEANARAMQQAGLAMEAHGATMLADGQRSNDADLFAHGEHWIADG